MGIEEILSGPGPDVFLSLWMMVFISEGLVKFESHDWRIEHRINFRTIFLCYKKIFVF